MVNIRIVLYFLSCTVAYKAIRVPTVKKRPRVFKKFCLKALKSPVNDGIEFFDKLHFSLCRCSRDKLW